MLLQTGDFQQFIAQMPVVQLARHGEGGWLFRVLKHIVPVAVTHQLPAGILEQFQQRTTKDFVYLINSLA